MLIYFYLKRDISLAANGKKSAELFTLVIKA